LSVGSGAQQTFTAADPRRLRVQLDVVDANGQSFVLAYDSAANPSNLNTPVVTVPEWGLLFLAFVPLIPYLFSLVWRRKRLAWQLISLLLAVCLAIGIQAGHVQPASAAPDYDIGTGTTFWFYDDQTPSKYMMYQTQPSGTSTSRAATNTYFYSDAVPVGWAINAGTSTVYLYATNSDSSSWDLTVYLQYGSGSTWTSLGSTTLTIPRNTSTPTLFSKSWSTSAHTFATSEILRVRVNNGPYTYLTIYWDGSYNTSRVVIPGITVPEAAVALLPAVLMIPMLAGAMRRRKAGPPGRQPRGEKVVWPWREVRRSNPSRSIRSVSLRSREGRSSACSPRRRRSC
jgi:hypothetical protein